MGGGRGGGEDGGRDHIYIYIHIDIDMFLKFVTIIGICLNAYYAYPYSHFKRKINLKLDMHFFLKVTCMCIRKCIVGFKI